MPLSLCNIFLTAKINISITQHKKLIDKLCISISLSPETPQTHIDIHIYEYCIPTYLYRSKTAQALLDVPIFDTPIPFLNKTHVLCMPLRSLP